MIDPWNHIVADSKQADYSQALKGLDSIMPEKPEEQPALLIVAHLREPQFANAVRAGGTDLSTNYPEATCWARELEPCG